MHNRAYGTSTYRPEPKNHPTRPTKAPKKSRPRRESDPQRRKLTLIALLSFGALMLAYILLSAVLGNMRFLMSKSPALLGFPFTAKEYLLLVQDESLARPGGGEITNIGVLKFANGFYRGITWLDLNELSAHSFIEPPLIMSALLESDRSMSITDAMQAPDFQGNIESVLSFYSRTQEEADFSGVIALSMQTLEDWTVLHKSFKWNEVQLNEESLFTFLVANPSETQKIIPQFINKGRFLPWRVKRTLAFFEDQLNQKNILISHEKPRIERLFESRNWIGAMPSTDSGDFVFINFADYGGTHASRYLQKDLTYEIDLGRQTDVLGNPLASAKLTVNLSHAGVEQWPLSGDIKGHLRVMLPGAVEVEKGSGITEDIDGVETLGELVELSPGESITYIYEYELPEYVWKNSMYQLSLKKQSGSQNQRVKVLVSAPKGLTVFSPLFDVKEQLASFETVLRSDTVLSFQLKDAPAITLPEKQPKPEPTREDEEPEPEDPEETSTLETPNDPSQQ